MATRQWNIWGGTDGWRKERTRVFKEKGTKRTVVDQGWRATDIHQGLASWRGGPAVADGREGDPKKKNYFEKVEFFSCCFRTPFRRFCPRKLCDRFVFENFGKKKKNDLEWTPSIFCFFFQTDFVRWIIKNFRKNKQSRSKWNKKFDIIFNFALPFRLLFLFFSPLPKWR